MQTRASAASRLLALSISHTNNHTHACTHHPRGSYESEDFWRNAGALAGCAPWRVSLDDVHVQVRVLRQHTRVPPHKPCF